jgi:hypothetical protein
MRAPASLTASQSDRQPPPPPPLPAPCRLLAYIGPDITIADVVVRPSRSIIKQSYDARERRNDSSLPFHLGYGNLNGDGFGIGWYPPASSASNKDSTPCVSGSDRDAVVGRRVVRVTRGCPRTVVVSPAPTSVPNLHLPPQPPPSPPLCSPPLPPLPARLCLQVYTSITPAWNNDNLNRLATKLESGVIFAHVRAAYPGMPVSKEATHPFQWGEHACSLPACLPAFVSACVGAATVCQDI